MNLKDKEVELLFKTKIGFGIKISGKIFELNQCLENQRIFTGSLMENNVLVLRNVLIGEKNINEVSTSFLNKAGLKRFKALRYSNTNLPEENFLRVKLKNVSLKKIDGINPIKKFGLDKNKWPKELLVLYTSVEKDELGRKSFAFYKDKEVKDSISIKKCLIEKGFFNRDIINLKSKTEKTKVLKYFEIMKEVLCF